MESWSNHPISAEHNMSPLQIFVMGHEIEELASDSEEDNIQTHDTNSASATEADEVSNLRYLPCDSSNLINRVHDLVYQ